MTTPNESGSPAGAHLGSEAAGSESPESASIGSGPTKGDWIFGLVLPLFALASVLGALWFSAFMADPGTGGYGYGAGAIGLLWYCFFALGDWARFRKRAAALLIWPLVGAWLCFGFGIYNLAMEYRGVVADCAVFSSETYKVESRSGPRWETRYSVDCDGQMVSLTEKARSYAPWDFQVDHQPGVPHVEYDPRDLIGARTENIGADPWRWILAGSALAVGGIGIRMLVRPTRRQSGPGIVE